MTRKKIKIGVLFGGKSAEHDVSLQSARNVINALDKKKYQVVLVKINRNGKFKFDSIKNFDVVFPVMHGPFGEDGSMQGLLKLAGVPFVGPSVLGSAVGMDKDVMKRLFRDAGILIGKFIVIKDNEKINFNKVKKELGLPVFVKPVNMGSSVGINKVRNEKEFKKAVKEAFKFDTKVIIEEFISGREIECSVLGNKKPTASIPGEIIANQEFYSYDAKYIDEESVAVIPAKIDKKTTKKIQELAIRVFKVLNCEGMGRVDFFLKKNGRVVVNEINTIPGFTKISMYPKLWEASGMPLPKLLDKLIELAIERFKKEQKLKTTVN
ncbi:D-alanine--D-alanine ligase A [Candidatus Nomurabacteria bacterium RIFCSPHIGHO2_01_FULL_43_16]|nr:MAG: D-alanine--D-alanine ligase A [Candidatus Nomurabacteria bacterium RIFCSPHIGHO2_01_FULL_43_16]OGI97535.1 MAG: D-alanine--D-alanine ligase A [Candidatus Nomurabacteria bacterium RIFCSPLOWO2_01_FULL_43_15]